jgi:hypothetical protein
MGTFLFRPVVVTPLIGLMGRPVALLAHSGQAPKSFVPAT